MSYRYKRIAWPVLALVVLAVASVLLARARPPRTARPSAPSDKHSGILKPSAVVTIVPADKTSTSSTSARPDPIDTKERGPVQMVRFTMFKQGIYPREIRVRAGVVNLAIEDKTNISSGLVIELEVGKQRISEVRRAEGSKRGREILRLNPGIYAVYDASQPANKARLVVELLTPKS